MTQVCAERAVAATDRIVKLDRRMAVVDQEQDPAAEAGRRGRDPVVEREADLGSLAVGQGDSLGLEAREERRRRRVDLDVDEHAVVPADRDLAQRITALHDAVGRQGVEDLVGQDEADDPLFGRRSGPDEGARVSGGLEPRGDRVEPPRLDLDRVVAQDAGEIRALPSQTCEDREPERPGPGTVFAEHERVRLAEPIPGVGDRSGEGSPEDRVRLRCRQEIAFPARASRVASVVAAAGVVESEVHESGEGDRAVAPDLVPDPGDELVILADRVEIRHWIASQSGRHVHRG